MEDKKKTKEQLIRDLAGLRRRVTELEKWIPRDEQETDPLKEKGLHMIGF